MGVLTRFISHLILLSAYSNYHFSSSSCLRFLLVGFFCICIECRDCFLQMMFYNLFINFFFSTASPASFLLFSCGLNAPLRVRAVCELCFAIGFNIERQQTHELARCDYFRSVEPSNGWQKSVRAASQDETENTQSATVSSSLRPSLRRRMDAAVDAPAAATHGDPPLVESLKRDWAQETINAGQIEEHAEGARTQGAFGLDSLADASTTRQYLSNVHQTMMRLYGCPKGAPEIDWVASRTPSSGRPLFCKHRLCWEQHLRGSIGSALEYRKHVQNLDFYPKLWRATRRRTTSIGLHGDAGSSSHQDSLLILKLDQYFGFWFHSAQEVRMHMHPQERLHTRHIEHVVAVVCVVVELARGLLRPFDGGGEPLANGW